MFPRVAEKAISLLNIEFKNGFSHILVIICNHLK